MSHEAEQQADQDHDRQFDHLCWRAHRLAPRNCTVTQVGKQGFYFLRPGKAAAEFMAWPVSEATEKYGRVNP